MSAEILHETPVLVVGGGPVGLLTVTQLSHHGIHCMLVERNLTTTRWPKMDITNCRSMELLRRLNLAERLREQGVDQEYSFDVLFSTGLGEMGECITKWDLPSPNEWRTKIKQQNDGSMPREPYQRCSQAIFEAWLKPIIDANPSIDSHFGLKFESLEEKDDMVLSKLVDTTTGQVHIVKSRYVVGCDGAGSRVRKSTGLKLTGGPVPGAMLLVHFKSRDLAKLHRQGRFWHIFFSHGGVIISQDEVDTWTTHLPISLEEDVDKIDPKEAVFKVLGGHTGPFPIEIDEILVKSSWRPNIAVADNYRTSKGRVLLAGDSAHQNIPTGGYGMNTGVGDAYDIGWKLAAVINGYGGEHLLASYHTERRPVALRNLERSGVHYSVHGTYTTWIGEKGPDVLLSNTDEGRKPKTDISQFVQDHDGENKDLGIEMGYSFPDSPVVINNSEGTVKEVEFSPRHYIPSTLPGTRAPHVFLRDGTTSIFDLYGSDYTVVDFTPEGALATAFEQVASSLQVPLNRVHLPAEPHARAIWQRDVILLRPDGHVAWRSANQPLEDPRDVDKIIEILQIAVGKRASVYTQDTGSEKTVDDVINDGKEGFTGTIGDVEQDTGEIEKLAVFQM